MNLRKYRYEHGFTRKFISSKVEISGKHLNDIEAGKVNLTESIAKKLSEAYGVDLDDIKQMYREGESGQQKDKRAAATAS